MSGSDCPSLPYQRIFREWDELGYKPEIMGEIFHGNAERIPGHLGFRSPALMDSPSTDA